MGGAAVLLLVDVVAAAAAVGFVFSVIMVEDAKVLPVIYTLHQDLV